MSWFNLDVPGAETTQEHLRLRRAAWRDTLQTCVRRKLSRKLENRIETPRPRYQLVFEAQSVLRITFL